MGSITYSAPDKADRLIWTDIQLNYQLSKNYETSIGQQLRYDKINDFLKWGVYDLEISRKLNKQFRLSSKYRGYIY